MPSRRTLDVTEQQRADLLHYRDHDPRPYVRERCAAILKVADGEAAYAVACHGLLKPRNPDTLYNWLNHFEEAGLEGLLGYQQGGPRRRCL